MELLQEFDDNKTFLFLKALEYRAIVSLARLPP